MAIRRCPPSLIGRLGSSTFRLSAAAVSMSLTGSCFSSESAPGPFHHGIRGRSGAILGAALPSDERWSKRTCDLTSSIVPRGTSFHRSVELEFPPIAFDPVWRSCRYDLPGPAELGAVNPDAVHDHGQPTRQRCDRLLHTAVPGDLHRPGLEPGPLAGAGQHDLGRFVEHDPHHLVSAPRYGAGAVALAGLVPGWRRRTDRLGVLKACGHVYGGAIGQRHHRTD